VGNHEGITVNQREKEMIDLDSLIAHLTMEAGLVFEGILLPVDILSSRTRMKEQRTLKTNIYISFNVNLCFSSGPRAHPHSLLTAKIKNKKRNS